MSKQYRVALRKEARTDLNEIKDQRTRRAIAASLVRLEVEPEKQGKALGGDLSGYRTVRSGGQRYRVVYSVEEVAGLVLVIVIGIRRQGSRSDAYEVARRRVRRSDV